MIGGDLCNALRGEEGTFFHGRAKIWRRRGRKWCGGIVTSPACWTQVRRRGCGCIYVVAAPGSFWGSHSGPEIRRGRCSVLIIRASPVAGTWRRGKEWGWRNDCRATILRSGGNRVGSLWDTNRLYQLMWWRQEDGEKTVARSVLCMRYPVVGGDGMTYGAGAGRWG